MGAGLEAGNGKIQETIEGGRISTAVDIYTALPAVDLDFRLSKGSP
jgi:hypothetical protein